MKLLLCSIINPGLAAQNYCFKSFLSSKAVAQDPLKIPWDTISFHAQIQFTVSRGKCLGIIYEL